MTPTRWYLKWDADYPYPRILLVVERVDDRRGYRVCFRADGKVSAEDRRLGLDHIRTLRALVEQIDAPVPVVRKVFDAVEVVDVWFDEAKDIPESLCASLRARGVAAQSVWYDAEAGEMRRRDISEHFNTPPDDDA